MATAIKEPTWSELVGSKNWQGLLEPLNLTLRRLILRCGDFCQATYDAFNNDPHSKYAGSSRYGKKSFFQKAMMESASDYQVYCFLYATARVGVPEAMLLHSRSRESWDRESNWIGYIATTTDEVSRALGRREIYVVWRGTSRDYEWLDVFSARPESAQQLLRPKSWDKKGSGNDEDEDEDKKAPEVMNGWLTVYVSDDPNSSFTKESARKQRPNSEQTSTRKMNYLFAYNNNENQQKNIRIGIISSTKLSSILMNHLAERGSSWKSHFCFGS